MAQGVVMYLYVDTYIPRIKGTRNFRSGMCLHVYTI